jgi:hypothetical protein
VSAPLTVGFAQPLIDVPRPVAIDLLAKLDEIRAALNAIPRGSTIWHSLLDSWLVLRVRDWRFQYRIDAPAGRIVVTAAAQARDVA